MTSLTALTLARDTFSVPEVFVLVPLTLEVDLSMALEADFCFANRARRSLGPFKFAFCLARRLASVWNEWELTLVDLCSLAC